MHEHPDPRPRERADLGGAAREFFDELRANVRWGVSYGLVGAGFFAAYAALVRLSAGEAPFRRVGLGLGGVILTYVAVGIVVGAVVGAMRPFTGTALGVFAVGSLASFVGFAGFVIPRFGLPLDWPPAVPVGLGILGLSGGVAVVIVDRLARRRE